MDEQDRGFCPECGAEKVMGKSCWEQLGAILAWEWQDSDLRAEHFSIVAAYNLQHSSLFTEEALANLRAIFIDHIDKGTPPRLLRRRMARMAAGQKKVLRDKGAQRTVSRQWPTTIADVYLEDRPENAAVRVRKWAYSVRNELSSR